MTSAMASPEEFPRYQAWIMAGTASVHGIVTAEPYMNMKPTHKIRKRWQIFLTYGLVNDDELLVHSRELLDKFVSPAWQIQSSAIVALRLPIRVEANDSDDCV